jgi:hypothetical protein
MAMRQIKTFKIQPAYCTTVPDTLGHSLGAPTGTLNSYSQSSNSTENLKFKSLLSINRGKMGYATDPRL